MITAIGLAAFSGSAAAAPPSCAGDGTDFNGGDGSSGTPYEIKNVSHLQCMNHTDHLDANFTLTDDVDASDTENWNDGAGFAPIGESGDGFTGSFDGQGHTISHLTVNRGTEDNVGLFGFVDGGSVANVTLDNATVDGNEQVGGLVGSNDGGSVTNASASGAVSGDSNVGGLVGQSFFGTVADSSASGTVSGGASVGGLVGRDESGTVTDSHATASVSASGSGSGTRVGGLIGVTVDGSVTDSYATGNVTGTNDVGGLVGITDVSVTGATVTTSYATGSVSGNDDVGGLVGDNEGGTVTDSYWDVNTTSQTTSASFGGTGLTTRQLTGDRADNNMDGFDFPGTWATVADSPGVDGYGVSYPVLTSNTQSPAPSSTLYAGGDGSESDPYVIEDWYHLDSVRVNLNANYTVATDLNSNTAGYDLVASATANGGDGFDPIGNDSNQFTGSFDGQNHTISDLTVNRSADSYVGMIGYVGTDGSVTNVTLDSASVTGSTWVGGLVGWNAGDVTAANSTGNVDGNTRVGGLVGWNDGTVSEAHSHGTVNGSGAAVGGLVGLNDAPGGSVSNSSTTATVNGTNANVGGFAGRNEGTITDSSAAGNVTGGQDVTDARVGGFAGVNDGSVLNSSATGNVDGHGTQTGGFVGSSGGLIADSIATGTVTGTTWVGGLVGLSEGQVTNSSAAGNVTGDSSVGGLVGYLIDPGSVTGSHAAGNVSGDNSVGGLVGRNEGDVTASYATGTVSGGDNVGGLIGNNAGAIGASVSTSYATGNVSGDNSVGGLIGNNFGTVTDSYWDVNTTNQTSSAGSPNSAGLTTQEMQRFAPSVTMDGFDFDATWNLTSAYPRLQWESVPAITVDSLDAANTTFDEDTNGTIAVTANESGVNAGQGVTVEVTATDGLGNLSNGDTAVTDANGEVTFNVTQNTPGDYTPMFAWADDTGVSDTATVIVVDVTDPTSNAGLNQTVDEDVQVDFNASNSTDNGVIDSYEWDFGDGNTSTGNTTNHTYADPGTYVVELTVTDGGANTDTDNVTITVEDLTAPTADAGSNLTVDEDTQVDFNGSASTDNGQIASYDWTFGDGTNATGEKPTHTYSQPGSYIVNLTVTDTAGHNDTDMLTVNVQEDTSGGGSSSGGSSDDDDDDQLSTGLDNGEGTLELDETILSIEIIFTDTDATGTVTVEPLETRPADTNPIPDASGLVFVDVTVPSSLTDSEATIRVTLDADAIDVEHEDLVVYHYDGGEWTVLETSLVSTNGDEVVIEATTPGFSLFAIAPQQQTSPEETDTPDETPPENSTPDEEETSSPGDTTPGDSTPDDEETRMTPPSDSNTDIPLTVIFVGALLLVAIGLVMYRRRS